MNSTEASIVASTTTRPKRRLIGRAVAAARIPHTVLTVGGSVSTASGIATITDSLNLAVPAVPRQGGTTIVFERVSDTGQRRLVFRALDNVGSAQTVDGKRLRRGRYLVTPRSVTPDVQVLDLGDPVEIRVG
jgi:hypothetical protein